MEGFEPTTSRMEVKRLNHSVEGTHEKWSAQTDFIIIRSYMWFAEKKSGEGVRQANEIQYLKFKYRDSIEHRIYVRKLYFLCLIC